MTTTEAALSVSDALKLVAAIDRRIDANRREGKPGHAERENSLFHERGQAQLLRDQAITASETRWSRPRSPKKCKSCGGSGYAKESSHD